MGAGDAVATSFLSVHRGVWDDPAVAAMVAPPVTVVSLPIGNVLGERPMDSWRRAQLQRSRGNMPVGRHRRPQPHRHP